MFKKQKVSLQQRWRKQMIDYREKDEVLNVYVALAFAGKAGNNEVLKAPVSGKGRKRSQERIKID